MDLRTLELRLASAKQVGTVEGWGADDGSVVHSVDWLLAQSVGEADGWWVRVMWSIVRLPFILICVGSHVQTKTESDKFCAELEAKRRKLEAELEVSYGQDRYGRKGYGYGYKIEVCRCRIPDEMLKPRLRTTRSR